MAVIAYRCTDCDREIQIIEQAQGLETFGRCIITNKCRGNLYRVKRHQDYTVGNFPDDVTGLTNWIQRNVVYNHTQAISDTTWTITHNLGVNPSVQVLVNRQEGTGTAITTTQFEIQPDTVTIIDENTLRLTFDRPESGLAQVIARSTRSTELVEAAAEATTYLPVTVDGILTIAIDCESGQFPATSATENTVRLYFLDQEELDATALESAAFKDYAATTTVDTTSAWSDVDEIFVNGDVYTVVSIDIGDPVTDFDAPSAGAVLFQFGTSTSGFPYDQAPNMVVLLSNPPHLNADKNRRRLFRPDLETGPALTLDSFIFANGELVVDLAATEEPFPPIYTIDAPQDCGYVAPAAPATDPFILAFGYTFSGEGGSQGVVYRSNTGVDTWSNIGTETDLSSPSGAVYVETLSRWVAIFRKGSSFNSIKYSDDDGDTWTTSTSIPSATGTSAKSSNIAWSPTLGMLAVGCNSGQIMTSTDGDTWVNASPGVFGTRQIVSMHWSESLGLFICGTSGSFAAANLGLGYSADGVNWSVSATPVPGTDDDMTAVYSIGSRVFVSNSDAEQVWYTDNLTGANTWTQATADANPLSSAGNFAANEDGSILLWGAHGANDGEYVWVSNNATTTPTFTRTLVDTQLGIADLRTYCLMYDTDSQLFVMGGESSSQSPTGHYIATSPDGLTWTLQLLEKALTGSPISGGAYTTRGFNAIASKNSTINGIVV
jgi:hypothetical protein